MFLCFLGGFNTLSCFLTPKCYLCVVFVCSLEQIGRNRLYYSSIFKQFLLYSAGGHCGSSPLRALPICWQTADAALDGTLCDQCVGPVLYFPELHRHSDARRHSGKQSAPTRDWGRWDTLQLRGEGRRTPPLLPTHPPTANACHLAPRF